MVQLISILTCCLAVACTSFVEGRPPARSPRRRPNPACFYAEYGNAKVNAEESLPPCFRRSRIAEACSLGQSAYRQNLTDAETQQCLCDGSFFEDSIGCGACLEYQDIISEDDYNEASNIFSSASSAYCGGSETADLNDVVSSIFSAASFTATRFWTGSGRPSTTKATEVSNYFTATAELLGPGLVSLATKSTMSGTPAETGTGGETATGESPAAETTDDDGGASVLSSIGLWGNLSLFGGVLLFLMN